MYDNISYEIHVLGRKRLPDLFWTTAKGMGLRVTELTLAGNRFLWLQKDYHRCPSDSFENDTSDLALSCRSE